MPLMSSQHFPIGVALQMSVQMRPHDLISARYVQLSVRISVVVSMSMNQSSSFEESCPSNLGISCSMVMMRFDSLCVACTVFVYACMVLCTGSSLGWGTECSYSIMVRCCILSVSCIRSAMGVDCAVVDFRVANWSLSCWNCSNNSTKGQQVSISSEYSSDDSLSLSWIGCSGGTRSRGVESWMQ